MKLPFSRKPDNQDFSKFVPEAPQSRKQRLLEECKRQDVSIYVDDVSEQSAGVYSELRAVASEAEIERRLNAKSAVRLSSRANVIALIALIVSFVEFVKSFL